MTLCNACGLRNAKRRCSGAVRQKPPPQPSGYPPPQQPQPQPQTPPQTPGYPQLAVQMQAQPPPLAHQQTPPMPPMPPMPPL